MVAAVRYKALNRFSAFSRIQYEAPYALQLDTYQKTGIKSPAIVPSDFAVGKLQNKRK